MVYRNWRDKMFKLVLPRLALGLLFIYFYCEYLIYYVTQIQCDWPTLKNEHPNIQPVYAMVLADTHLLGSRQGHWYDKWRREWQMHRAFQTAMTLHRPEAVFVLGDLFDEGKWCSEKEFNDYVERFNTLFKVPEGTQMYPVVGNHDIGFHYRITPHLAHRFEKKLSSPPVRLVTLRGNHFVLINSMAMEGDGCGLCARAVTEIDSIADVLKCSLGSTLCKSGKKLEQYSRPIIMQHYPLYRESDKVCTEPDAAPLPERNNLFEERWDCLSKESTEYLVESLLPRAAFGAHTHHSCLVRHSFSPTANHKIEFVEYTVPSFSWRNRVDPKYYLETDENFKLRKCLCTSKCKWILMDVPVMTGLAASPAHGSGTIQDAVLSLGENIALHCGMLLWRSTQSLTITPEEVKMSKCGLPRESTMQLTAILMALTLLLYLKYYYSSLSHLHFKQWSGKKV